ncbi:CBS domain-containing protein [Cohnella pontilimi]|uniref:CBS domain-containing protein n=1 Tax=Cohnella pontilimi TaxID=2564100 RepID=A0A4U0FAY3_9BACL|nr:nucleotidyltransferase family protein [Cohnella pontilimi]TJY41966.1 CBS domain-containing protein [Cohnella pontilimi]
MKWVHITVSPQSTILDALRIIDRGGMQIAAVLNERKQLAGTLTDGDIRRGILKGVSLDSSVTDVMNETPIIGLTYESKKQWLDKMVLHRIRQLPIVDEEGLFIDFVFLDELQRVPVKENWVVIMAGGLGTRLRPLTDNCPKPMLKIGGKPLLETIIDNFKRQGFRHFLLSVNYMADKIIQHFGDGAGFGVEIRYLRENMRLGTAGALSLLPERPKLPFLIMNGDLLTKVDFNQLLQFHEEQGAIASMCLREYDYQVPYGVVEVDKQRLVGLKEKPLHRYFINAGIYAMSPEVVDRIPPRQFLDMTTLFDSLIKDGFKTGAYPIREYWMDIGRLDDFERANGEFLEVFG